MRHAGHENVSQGKPAAIAALIADRTKAHAARLPRILDRNDLLRAAIASRSASAAWLPPMFDVSSIEQSGL